MKNYLFSQRNFSVVGLVTFFFIAAFENGNAFAPSLLWAKQLGSTGNDKGTSIIVDSNGNVYTAGDFQGTVDFDPGAGVSNLTSAGSSDVFISKLDSSGNFVWAKRLGGTGIDGARAIATDNNGYIYIAGEFSGTYIAKLDTSGNLIWGKNIGGTGQGISVDALGNVYTTGFFSGTGDFDPGPSLFNLVSFGGADIFISKINSLGNFVWAKQLGGTSPEYAYSIKVDAIGNVYTTGSFTGTTDFDPGTGTFNLFTSGIFDDFFISKLDASGNFLWAKQFATNIPSAHTESYSLTLDPTGGVYTIGTFGDTVDFDPGANTFNLIPYGSSDIFISKLDASGNFVWAKRIGGLQAEVGYYILADDSGNIYTTGCFYGNVDFDPGSGHCILSAINNTDIYAAKYDTAGNFKWAVGMGGPIDDAGFSIAAGGNGNVYVTGYFLATSDFDPGIDTTNLVSAGSIDAFVVALTELCIPSSSSINRSACNSFASPSGLYTWTTSGTYLDTINNANGCDSAITINLTINIVDTSITPNGITLQANAVGATFQWLDCNNGYNAIAGDTNALFTASTNGNYSVAITQNGCSDTSSCYLITGAGGCFANFFLYPDTAQAHHYYAVNNSFGVPPLTYDWSWGDGTNDYTAYPSHAYADTGTYTICLIIMDSVGCSSTYCDSSVYLARGTSASTMVYVNVVDQIVTDVPQLLVDENGLSIYPNPATNKLVISSRQFAIKAIEIYNLLGEKLLAVHLQTANCKLQTELDVSALPPGVYFVKVQSEKGSVVRKLVVE